MISVRHDQRKAETPGGELSSGGLSSGGDVTARSPCRHLDRPDLVIGRVSG